MRKICVVTGSRAEYGLLSRLMSLILADPDLKLQIVATNMHLSPEFGLTYKEIETDGFIIDKKVEMLLSSDSSNATTKSVGLGVIGFADAFEDLQPDLLVVLGDRFEILAAVSAAIFNKIPVAHIHGGEITEGAYDDAIRHAVTKMSHIHFTSTEIYRKRVIQMGERPESVYNVGALGLDNITHLELLSLSDLENKISFSFSDNTIIVTYHPVTLENMSAEEQIDNLLDVLEEREDVRIIFTLPNSDTGGRVIIDRINDFVNRNKRRAVLYTSLGQLKYLSSLLYVKAVVGNSSSGVIEVPSFGIPSLNIGDRQKGRLKAASVIDCGITKVKIRDGLEKILNYHSTGSIENPYQKKDTAENIIKVLREANLSQLIKKTFYDIPL